MVLGRARRNSCRRNLFLVIPSASSFVILSEGLAGVANTESKDPYIISGLLVARSLPLCERVVRENTVGNPTLVPQKPFSCHSQRSEESLPFPFRNRPPPEKQNFSAHV